MFVIEFNEIHFVKFDETSFIKFDEMSFMFNESLSFKFDEWFSLNINHLEKTRIKQSKHKRWNDQAWSWKRIHKNISAKKKSEIAFLDHIWHFWNKMQNMLLTFSQQIAFFEKNIFNFLQKKKIIKRKTIYNRHVLEKFFFQNN
jgi:hypothetical protein